ncbi:MAG: transcription antitermination factor NusB [Bacteriovoracaceae bacterium]|nr:transcription antitermination factor NusB [Bacteriovoracaceae bacterium]
MSNSSSNSLAREYAFKFVYHLQLENNSDLVEKLKSSENPMGELETERLAFDVSFFEEDNEHPNNSLPEEARFFGFKHINNILGRYETLKEELKPFLRGWTLDRIDKTDLIVLLLGLSELNDSSTPKKVVINEAINLSKKYGNKDSYSFVNGVLDSYGSK